VCIETGKKKKKRYEKSRVLGDEERSFIGIGVISGWIYACFYDFGFVLFVYAEGAADGGSSVIQE
jgi:hypothetical protein